MSDSPYAVVIEQDGKHLVYIKEAPWNASWVKKHPRPEHFWPVLVAIFSELDDAIEYAASRHQSLNMTAKSAYKTGDGVLDVR